MISVGLPGSAPCATQPAPPLRDVPAAVDAIVQRALVKEPKDRWPNMAALRRALAHLKKHKVKIEDPGDEIGPEAPGSPNMGLWFYDPDGYRWELSVQGGR